MREWTGLAVETNNDWYLFGFGTEIDDRQQQYFCTVENFNFKIFVTSKSKFVKNEMNYPIRISHFFLKNNYSNIFTVHKPTKANTLKKGSSENCFQITPQPRVAMFSLMCCCCCQHEMGGNRDTEKFLIAPKVFPSWWMEWTMHEDEEKPKTTAKILGGKSLSSCF